ncbi:MAG: hypothetical protein ACOX47_08885 [Bacillota bacterium]|jgi:uncharacterized membrane protein
MAEQNNHGLTEAFDPIDIQQNKTMAGLAYILFFLPLITDKDSKFGRFHANQGLLLLITSIAGHITISVVSGILTAITWRFYWLTTLLYGAFSLAVIALFIMGLMNGLNGKAKELPIIGGIRIIN